MEENHTETTPILQPNKSAYQRSWLKRTGIYVYCSHFLSAWGDRMWSFGVGLFLIELAPESLQLTAIYGLCNGGAVLLFGALVGDWVDKNPRLKAARLTLIAQNVCVICGAVVVYLLIFFKTPIEELWEGWLTSLFHAILILFAVVAQLASVGNTIAIERDWIVEICGRDTLRLTEMTATLRRIDLVTKIVAPIATGQIMAFGSLSSGAIFIAGWNLVSVFVEYFLIWKVYVSVPALANKKHFEKTILSDEDAIIGPESDCFADPTLEGAVIGENSRKNCCYTMFGSFITLAKGWQIFMKYTVAYAGIGLACLYMTVLGFDNITTGYAYSQGMSESILGILTGVGAVVGIIGTFMYPVIKNKVGLVRTGLFSMAFQIACLIVCVASVWAPGSPYVGLFREEPTGGNVRPIRSDLTTYTPPTDFNVTNPLVSRRGFDAIGLDWENEYIDNNNLSDDLTNETSSTSENATVATPKSYLSLGLLMGGIVTARFGLWITDLTITQQILETVDETERGTFSGVQTSINKMMDLIKFAMVVALPEPEQFGNLVLVSFAFVILGYLLYAVYSRKVRSHILPFHKFFRLNLKNLTGNRKGIEKAGYFHSDEWATAKLSTR